MTEKLYHHDSYQTVFQATILKKSIAKGRHILILNQSCFYPDSGGQICDRGMIERIPVIDVEEVDGTIIHYLADKVTANIGDTVTGEIDWKYRFDHMQQHSGQHILSGVLIDLWQKETQSFHMGKDLCMLDILITPLDNQKMRILEEMANRIIYENRPIYHYYAGEDNKIISKRLRKEQELHEELRIIEIEKFDLTACGGTHCRYTGEVGIIKITGWENRKDKTRISFLCGHRALSDYQEKHGITKHLSGIFTTGVTQLEEKIIQISNENKNLSKQYNGMEKKLNQFEAEELIEKYGMEEKGLFIVRRLFSEKPLQSLKQIALMLINQKKCLVILGAEKPEVIVCLACSQGFSLHMGKLMEQMITEYNGKGGGSNFMAMGKLKKSKGIGNALKRATELMLALV